MTRLVQGRYRLLLLLAIMGLVATGSVAATLYTLHQAALESEQVRIRAMAKSKARLIDSIHDDELLHSPSPELAFQHLLAQLDHAFEGWYGELGHQAGEVGLARRQGDRIVYLLRQGPSGPTPALTLPWTGDGPAHPMHLALEGKSGIHIGPDHRGVEVLAAYEYLPVQDLGLVVKMELSQLRSPLEHAAWHALQVALLLILVGGLLFTRIGEGVIRRLREAEQDLAITLDAIGDGVLVTDSAGRVTRMNPVAERLTGWSLGEARLRPVEEVFPLFHAQTRERRAGPVDGVIRTRQAVELANHTALVARDGTERQIADSAAPVLDPGGRLLGVVLVFRDVTLEYQRRQELAASEERLRTLVEKMPVLLAAFDGNRRLLVWNRECERVTGHAAGEMIGNARALALLFPDPADRRAMETEWERRGNDFTLWEREMRARDGSTRIVAWSNISSRFPIPGWASWEVGIDLTGLRRSEARLRHLAALRLAVRTINLLAADSSDPLEFAQRACHHLTAGDPGCRHAWILLREGDEGESRLACAGLTPEQEEGLRHALGNAREGVPCLERIRSHQGPLILEEGSGGCGPPAGPAPELRAMGMALGGGERFLGVLVVTVPAAYARDGDFLEKLQEVGEGITGGVVRLETAIRQRQDQERLRASEARYRNLFEHMRSGVAVYTTPDQGRTFLFQDYNRAARDMDRMEGEQVVGRDVTRVFPGVEEFGLLEVFRRVWRTGMPEHHPISFYQDQRLRSWRENFVYRLDDGSVVAVYDDVTEAKRAGERVRRSEEKYRTLFDSLLDGLLLGQVERGEVGTAERFTIVEVNPALERLSATPAREWLGRELTLVARDPAGMTTWEEVGAAVVHTGLPASLEIFQSEWGRYLYVAAFPTGGDLVALLFRDVTPQRRQEAQLRQAQKMEAIGTLAGGIAHDFNNILGVILGFVELVLGRLPRGSQPHQDLEEVMRASLRARDLVAQLLTFSRQGERRPQAVPLVPLVKETMKFLRAVLPANLGMETRLAKGGELVVQGDPTEIHQVLMNLCTNAADAMRDGGQLGVELRMPGPPLPAPLQPATRWVELSVTDTGHGIPTALLSRIFDPFFTTKRVGEGTGLGLAVVHGIVTAMGGVVQVESTLGRGSRFRIFWPLLELATPGAVDPTLPPALNLGLRVLVVDDEPQLLEVVSQQLRHLGCEPITAASPGEALALLAQGGAGGVDLVIVDRTMPQMTGAKLLGRIRELGILVPVILTSGHYDAPAAGVDDAGAGFAAFLPKPVTVGVLLQVLRNALPEKT